MGLFYKRFPLSVLLIISAVLLIYTAMQPPSGPDDSVGQAVSVEYPQYAMIGAELGIPLEIAFSDADDQKTLTFTINDDRIYKTAYISINASNWRPINLTGSNISSEWIKNSATGIVSIQKNTIPASSSDENYVIFYSCTRKIGLWDCHDNRWQIKQFRTIRNATSGNCNDEIGGCSGFTRTFYVSSSGNDANAGTSPSSPWKTISKVNNQSFLPGDAILFKRGDSWREALLIKSSGSTNAQITYGAYGVGEKPLITGFTSVDAWNNLGGNIWESANPVSNLQAVNMVTVNNVNVPMGTYPNSNDPNGGYISFQSHSGSTSITSSSLTGTPDWRGAQIVIRSSRWSLDKSTIISQSDGQLTYAAPTSYVPADGFGFFIQNDPRTLDWQNEWYYNSSTKKLLIYSSSMPSNVNVASIDNLVSVNSSYIVISDLAFTGANNNSIYGDVRGTVRANITIKNSSFAFIGKSAIGGLKSSSYLIENNNISDANSYAIDTYYSTNAVIRNNVVQNTGIHKGMSPGYGALSVGASTLVEYNRVINSGHNGINFYGSSTTIKNNFLDTFCSVLDDGGGIYTGGGNSSTVIENVKIHGNIVINAISAPAGTNNVLYTPANGIYLDSGARNIEVYDNSVANVADYGIFMNNPRNIKLHDNTVYNGQSGQLRLNNIKGYPSLNNNVFEGNIFVSRNTTQKVLSFNSYTDDVTSFASLDDNYYMTPADDAIAFITSQPSTGSVSRLFENWQIYMNQDSNSQKYPLNIRPYTVASLIGTSKFANSNFATNLVGVSGCWSNIQNCNQTWNDSALDDGTLQVVFDSRMPTANPFVSIPVGVTSSDKNYVLRYTILSAANNHNTYSIYLRKRGSPYTRLTTAENKALTNARTENEIIFTKPITETDAAIFFEFSKQDGTNNTIWIDNVELYEAEISPSFSEYLFEYNPSRTNKVVALNGEYIDAKNKTYSSSITLKPYTSIVLVRK